MPDVFGREAELVALRRFVGRIPEEPCALILEGEPGIGKTTLWEVALAFAHEHDLRVLWCRPAESEARLSYGALADLLAASVDEVLEELPGVQRKAIEVALLREATEAPVDRRTVSAATLGVLRALSRVSPVLVAVDDQQWIDAASAEVLAFAARRLTDEPVGFLIASRARTGTADPMGLVRAVPEDRLVRVRVGPLELEEIADVIRDRIGFVPPRAVLRRVQEVTRGNPFFALQLARALQGAGGRVEPSGALPVPEDLRDLLRARLADLPPATGEMLLLASAHSRPTVTLLEAAASDPEAVSSDLRQSVTAGILEVTGDDVRFSHPLFAGAVYTEAPIARRREAHRRLARIVAEPEEQARHRALSSDQPEAGVAGALEEAALHAVARGAPAAAAELYELAAVRTPPDLGDDLRRRRLGAADAWLSSGDLVTAIGILETVLAGCPPGAARAEVLVELGRAHWDDDLAAAAGRFAEALEQPGIEPTVRVEAHLLLATCLADLGSLVEADSHVRAGSDLAERLNHPGLIGWAMVESAGLDFYLGRAVERDGLLRAERLLNGADLPRNRAVDPDPNFELAIHLVVSDELDEARSRLHRTRSIASERGDEPWIAFCDAWLSDLEFRAGDWDLALRHAAASKLEASGIVYPGTPEHIIATHRGRAEAVRPAAQAALTAAERAGTLIDRLTALWTLATMEIVADDDPRADRFSGRAWELLRETGIGEPGLAQFVPDEGEVLIRLGRLAEAEELVAWLEERGRTLDRPRALATGARCRGLLLAASGDTEEALVCLERSVNEHERLPDPFERGRTLLALGTVRRHAKQKAAAREVLDEALAIFERLGATPWVERVRAELAAIGGRPPPSGQLTPTEERVARLAAAGRTNREIADSLFLSVRTVESHLSHAYAKLGVRSRTELALVLEPRDDST